MFFYEFKLDYCGVINLEKCWKYDFKGAHIQFFIGAIWLYAKNTKDMIHITAMYPC